MNGVMSKLTLCWEINGGYLYANFLCFLGCLCSSSKLNISCSSSLFKVVSQPILVQTMVGMIRSKIVVQFCR